MKINTKIVMIASSLFMGFIGVAASFMPHELLNNTGVAATGIAPLIVQVLGALYLGFAGINWMSKGVIIGGIYARPLALGNFTHFVVGALTLIKGATLGQELEFFWIITILYVVFGILFGLIMFTHPLTTTKESSSEK